MTETEWDDRDADLGEALEQHRADPRALGERGHDLLVAERHAPEHAPVQHGGVRAVQPVALGA